MRILLDSYYLYGLMAARGQFSEAERRFFDEHDAQLHVSAVSIWEMRLKYHARHSSASARALSAVGPNEVVVTLEMQEAVLLSLTTRHAAREFDIPLDHKNPFDELLLIQAQEEGLKLLTTDRWIIGHPLAITV